MGGLCLGEQQKFPFFSEDWKVVEGFRVLSATKIRDLPNPSGFLENWSTPTKNRSNFIKNLVGFLKLGPVVFVGLSKF
jgi:hypothetical protein